MLIEQPPLILRWLYPRALWRMDKNVKAVYLTFDDGPIPGITPWVLDLLDKYQIKATFFLVGDNVRKHPEEFKMDVLLVEPGKYPQRVQIGTELEDLQKAGKVIELREYNTVHGIWKYFTVDDGQFDAKGDVLAIGTLESYEKTAEYFGKEKSQSIIGIQMASAYLGVLAMPSLFGIIANHIDIKLLPYYLLILLIIYG